MDDHTVGEKHEVTLEIRVVRGKAWAEKYGVPEGTIEEYGPFVCETGEGEPSPRP